MAKDAKLDLGLVALLPPSPHPLHPYLPPELGLEEPPVLGRI